MSLNAEDGVLEASSVVADHMTALTRYNEVVLADRVPLHTLDIFVDALG